MPLDASIREVRQAVNFWFHPTELIDIVPITTGLSGTQLWKLSLANGTSWALRRWPIASQQRLQQIHRFLKAGRTGGCALVPKLLASLAHPQEAIVHENSLWDCQEWLPGRHINLDTTNTKFLSNIAAAAASFSNAVELSTADAIIRPDSWKRESSIPGAITSRLQRLQELGPLLSGNRDRLLQLAQRLGPERLRVALLKAVEATTFAWPTVSRKAVQQLERWRYQRFEMHPIVGDLHPGNVLFVGDLVSGIVDLGAARWDTSAADLARLWNSAEMSLTGPETVTSVNNWGTNSANEIGAIVAAYCAVRPLKQQEIDLAFDLAWVSPLITLGNWLDWLLFENREFVAIQEVVQRLEGWSRVVARRATFPVHDSTD